jgi:hypothetical protein
LVHGGLDRLREDGETEGMFDDVTTAPGFVLNTVILTVVLLLIVATILMPLYVIGIHSQLKLLNRKVMRLIELKEHEMGLRTK